MKKLWLGAVVLLSGLVLVGCGSSSSGSSDSSSLKAENSSLKKQVKSLKAQIKTQSGDTDDEEADADTNKNKTEAPTAVLGKEYVITNKKGKKLVGITLTQADNKYSGFATEDEEDPEIDDSEFNLGKKDNVVQISAKYTNYAEADGWYPDFDVYDDTGAMAKSNDYEDGGDDVSIGHSGTLTTWYVLSKPYAQNHKLEIEFSDYLGDNNDVDAIAKWVIEY